MGWDGMGWTDGYLWMGPSIEHLTVLIRFTHKSNIIRATNQ